VVANVTQHNGEWKTLSSDKVGKTGFIENVYANHLIDAHNQAVDFAVRQVEALASTRVMTDGQSETVLTGNLVMALFNHDTSRDQEPQLHTHAVVANVTQHNGEWKTLSSDKVGKTGFIENVYAN
ncbi:relaxase domain-containing protein, partial [Escherichia coli]